MGGTTIFSNWNNYEPIKILIYLTPLRILLISCKQVTNTADPVQTALAGLHCLLRHTLLIFLTSGLVHPYHLDESICSLGVSGEYLYFCCILHRNALSKQYRPWSDAASCGIWTGSLLFAYVPKMGIQSKKGAGVFMVPNNCSKLTIAKLYFICFHLDGCFLLKLIWLL